MKLSMVMIAKNEKENIERCFNSFWGFADEVVFVDTGSTDGTVEAAEAFAAKRGQSSKLIIGHFDWVDDFAAARNYADSLATGDWLCWTDLDDEIFGLGYLRQITSKVTDDTNALYVKYDYGFNANGEVACQLWRERFVRKNCGEWIGRIHECIVNTGKIYMVDYDKCHWIHKSNAFEVTDRNIKILRSWIDEEPSNARAISYLAFELMGLKKEIEKKSGQIEVTIDPDALKESIVWHEKYLELPTESPELRAQAVRRLSLAHIIEGNFDKAYELSAPVLADCPSWPDTYLTLAEISLERGENNKCIEFAGRVIERGQPETMLIVNPEDYTHRPKVLMASAYATLGQFEKACQVGQDVVKQNPNYMGISSRLSDWLGKLQIEQTAKTWVNCAQQLCESDDPEKAWLLLENVPYFCNDNPLIISAKVQVKNFLSVPYQVQELKANSPRANFLLRSLEETYDTTSLKEEVAA